MDFNSYEYTVDQRCEGKWLLGKIGLILLYVAYSAIFFGITYVTKLTPLCAILPLTLWIMVYFTWRYTSPEYKYEVESGELRFYVIYGGKKKREKFRTRVADAEMIAPKDEVLSRLGSESPRHFSATPKNNCPDEYAVLFKQGEKRCIFTFRATRDAIKILHYYNKSTVIKDTEF